MGLIAELNASASTIVDCVRLAAVWVGHIDHEFSDAERDAILNRLPDRPDGMPLSRMVAYVRSELNSGAGELGSVFSHMKKTLANESREPLLRLVTEIVAADGRVSIGERHALAFLADLMEKTPDLPAIFEEETGVKWAPPADLSDSVYWERLESAQRSRRQSEGNGQARSGAGASGSRSENGPDAERIAALAVLGLVGEPSAEDIKAAYRRLAKVHHPDRFHGLDAEAVEHATRAFQRIQKAYEMLR